MVTISVPAGISGSAATSKPSARPATGSRCGRGAGAAFGFRGRRRGFGGLRLLRAAAGALAAADASSPSASRSAIGVLTLTSSVPAGIRILPSVPSSTASTSIVALSVSISAMTSPDLTVSPSFLSHLESVALLHGRGQGGHQNFDWHCNSRSVFKPRAQSGTYRCRARMHPAPGPAWAKSAAVGDDVTHLGVDRLEVVLGRASRCSSRRLPAPARSGRARGAPSVYFLAGPVLGRIGHRVAAIAIGLHFQNERTLAGAAMLDRLGHRRPSRRATSMPSTCSPGMLKETPRLREVGLRRGARRPRCPWRSGCSR